jgi:S1-C subfamily serine protease
VNGERLDGERALFDGDLLTFGTNGPQCEFRVLADAPGATAPAKRADRPASPPAGAPRQPTEVRIAHAVEQQTGALKRMVIGLATVVILGALAAVWVTRKSSAETRAQLAALLAANDSLARTLDRRIAQTLGMDSAMQAWRDENERLAHELRQQQARGGDVSALSARVRDAQVLTAVVARMDYAAIAAANQRAVTFLVVEFPDSARASGTGFNVLPGGLIVTNRHVVENAAGERAQRVAVAFDGTPGAWKRATVLYVSETDELALLRITTAGTYPVVAGIARDASTVPVGSPIAMLGYPLGTSTAGMDGNINDLRPVATLGVGTVSKVIDETLQLDGFAAQGSSGSPVFDARGYVVGVIYGGATESGGRIVYAVPSARLAAQLPPEARAILR